MDNPNIQKKLESMLETYDGINAIIVNTVEGITLMKAVKAGLNIESPEYVETVLPVIFATVSEQASKLAFGGLNTLTNFFDKTVIIHINHLPLILTIIAEDGPETGAIMAFASELPSVFDQIREAVDKVDGLNA